LLRLMKRSSEVAASWTRTTKDLSAVANNSIRDSQRERVYKAETFAEHGTPDYRSVEHKPEFKTVTECQEYVDFVAATDAYAALDVYQLEPIEVLDGRGRRRACAVIESDQIKLPKFARDKFTILHELAHIAVGMDCVGEDRTVAPHGPEFTGIVLYFVHEFLGPEMHDKLAEAYESFKVKVNYLAPYSPSPAKLEEVPVKVIPTTPREPADPIEVLVTEPVTTDDTHNCLYCGTALASARAKFCADDHRHAYHNAQRSVAAAAERVDLACAVCGTPFTPARADSLYCSNACKMKAYRAKKA
jgi:putative metallohydrolase (TIGR04338 family)